MVKKENPRARRGMLSTIRSIFHPLGLVAPVLMKPKICTTTVLRYINNKISRFKTYIANRVEAILDLSSPFQWRYVGMKINSADEASRNISVENFPHIIRLKAMFNLR